MINGVLVERTVKDVVPALKTNAEGLQKVLDDLVKQYKTKQNDLEKWKVGTQSYPSSMQTGIFLKYTPSPLGYKIVELKCRFNRKRTTSKSFNREGSNLDKLAG